MSDTRIEPRPENKMGVMPVNRLLISMSIPMMISMLVQALYNIVDSMFVAQLSENALTAVSLYAEILAAGGLVAQHFFCVPFTAFGDLASDKPDSFKRCPAFENKLHSEISKTHCPA